MSRIFISHSSSNELEALAIKDWLVEQGWDDYFLDLDPERGLVAGERWQNALKAAAERCEFVIFLISPAWISSTWCVAEFLLAKNLNKVIFGVIVEPTSFDDIPIEMKDERQLANLVDGNLDCRFMVSPFTGGQDKIIEYSSNGLQSLKAGLIKAGIEARYFEWPPRYDPDRPPYRGLRALEEEDAGIFYGRDGKIVEAIEKLRGIRNNKTENLMLILGASGAGKSSFMKAGLIPRLKRDDRHFIVMPVVRPEHKVLSGDAGLINSLEACFETYNIRLKRADLRKAVESGSDKLSRLLLQLIDVVQKQFLSGKELTKAPSIILPIDQAEELHFLDEGLEADKFKTLIKALMESEEFSFLTMMTLRSDSYERFQFDEVLGNYPHSMVSLPPMAQGSYKDIILGPVDRLAGTKRALIIDDQLVDALLSDIEKDNAKDALPLLAFTLERLYRDYGGGGEILFSDYVTSERIQGSIEAAVAQAMDRAKFDPNIPSDPKKRDALLRKGLIPLLASVDPQTGAVRRNVALLSSIPEAARPLLECLVEQRLLSKDVRQIKADIHEITIEPAHEALLRQWTDLSKWLDEDVEHLIALEGLKRAAKEWDDKGRADDWLLHSDGRLESVEGIARKENFEDSLEDIDRAYLKAARAKDNAIKSREIAQQEETLQAERKAAHRTKLGLIVTSILVVIAMGFAGWAMNSEMRALKNLSDAKVNQSKFLIEYAENSAKNGEVSRAQSIVLKAVALLDANNSNENKIRQQALAPLIQYHLQDNKYHGFFNSQIYFDHISLSSDGTKILTVRNESELQIWDVETGVEILKVMGQWSNIRDILFLENNYLIANLSRDETLQVFTSNKILPIMTLNAQKEAINDVKFSSDGKKILITYDEKDITKVWDIETKKNIRFKGKLNRIYSDFSKNNELIVTTRHHQMPLIWDVETGAKGVKLKCPNPGGDCSDIAFETAAFSQNGEWIVTTSNDNITRIWSAVSGELLDEKPLRHGQTKHAKFIYDDSTIAVFYEDGGDIGSFYYSIEFWGVKASSETLSILHIDIKNSEAPKFSMDLSKSNLTSKNIEKILNTKDTIKVGDYLIQDGNLNSIGVSPDGEYVAMISLKGNVEIRSFEKGILVSEIQTSKIDEGKISKLKFSPDGKYILTLSKASVPILWDTFSGQYIRTLEQEIDVNRDEGWPHAKFEFSPDGKQVLFLNHDAIQIVSVETGKTILPLSVVLEEIDANFIKEINCASYSPDSKYLIISVDDQAFIFYAKTGKLFKPLLKQARTIYSCSYSPNGKKIVLGYNGKLVEVRDSLSGVLRSFFPVVEEVNEDELIEYVEFLPNNNEIIFISTDGSITKWNSKNPTQFFELDEDVLGDVYYDISLDRQLLAVYADKYNRVLNIDNGALYIDLNKLIGADWGIEKIKFEKIKNFLSVFLSDSILSVWDFDFLTLNPIDFVNAREIKHVSILDDSAKVSLSSLNNSNLLSCDKPLIYPKALKRKQWNFNDNLGSLQEQQLFTFLTKISKECNDSAKLLPKDLEIFYKSNRLNYLIARNKIEFANDGVIENTVALAQLNREQIDTYQILSDQGHGLASYTLAEIYEELGAKEPKYNQLAFDAFKLAYDQKLVWAGEMIGQYYWYGIVVEKDRKKAIQIWQEAAAKGDGYSHKELARLYALGDKILGNPIRRDLKIAMKHYAVAMKLMENKGLAEDANNARARKGTIARLLPAKDAVEIWREAMAWAPIEN